MIGYLGYFFKTCMGSFKNHIGLIKGSTCDHIRILKGSHQDLNAITAGQSLGYSGMSVKIIPPEK